MLELSCRDNTFVKLSHPMALRVIADLAIPAVDITLSDRHRPHITAEDVVDDPERVADEALRGVRDAGLKVADVFAMPGMQLTEVPVNHRDPQVREVSRRQFDAFVTFARAVGSPGITILPGIASPDEPAEASVERAVEELSHRVQVAGDAGLELSFEPFAQSVAPTPPDVLALVERVRGLRVTLDYSHFVAQGIAESDVDVLVPHTRHIHGRQAAEGTIQTSSRSGTIDFRRIVGLLEDSSYQGYFGLEYIWNEWVEPVDCISETAVLRDVVLETRRG